MGSRRFTTFGLGCLLGVASCGSPAEPVSPTQIRLLSGEGHTVPTGYPVKVVVEVSNDDGPLAGVSVVFRVVSGGGLVSPSVRTTGLNGQAWAIWALGGTIGEQQLEVGAGAEARLTLTMVASTGPNARMVILDGNDQYAVANRPVPSPPAIRLTDAFGNPISGEVIVFRVTGGGGRMTDSMPATDETGRAQLGSWILGPEVGINRLLAWTSGATATFIATGTPAALVPFDGMSQSANAGTVVPTAPAVRAIDDDGNSLADVTVKFLLDQGEGSVEGTVQITDPAGVARVGAWRLDPNPGTNTLIAETPGLVPVIFTAEGIGTSAVSMTSVWLGATTFRGNFLLDLPAVVLADAEERPVAGQVVAFTALDGGSVFGAIARTDESGVASVGAWRLGPTVGTQRLVATTQDIPPLTFEATAASVPSSAFEFEARYLGMPPGEYRPIFDRAVRRWERLIVDDLPDVEFSTASNWCPAFTGHIDDILVFIELGEIDGPRGILGMAGPCHVRADSRLPLLGHVVIDTADIRRIDSLNLLETLVLHELGHVLGIGSLWGRHVVGRGTPDPRYRGPGGRAAWTMISETMASAWPLVPVENSPRPGTRDNHWRESVFEAEVMTGYIDSGRNPLSALTVTSLRDLGYVVDDAGAEPYTLPNLLISTGGASLRLHEPPRMEPIFLISRTGERVGVLPW